MDFWKSYYLFWEGFELGCVSAGKPIENVHSIPYQIFLHSAAFTVNVSFGMILCNLEGLMLHRVLISSGWIE